MYGHILKLAEAEKRGVEAAGGHADMFQVSETLSDDVLAKMYAPPKSNYPIATPDTLLAYDAFLFGIPTRFGSIPAQWKVFWDATGQLWYNAGLYGKKAGVFVSTSGTGGQETTVISVLPNLVHHGISFVPLGYKNTRAQFGDFSEAHAGGPWGAGTFVSQSYYSNPVNHRRVAHGEFDRPGVMVDANHLNWSSKLPRFKARASTRISMLLNFLVTKSCNYLVRGLAGRE